MRWFTNRKYKSGTGWCVWRWTDVDSSYITRLHIIKTPFFAVCLHWLNKPDPEPYLHDHPVSFLSIILRGWYREMRATVRDPLEIVEHRWFNWIPASRQHRHTIYALPPGGALTICFMGPKTQEWGFHDVTLNDDGDIETRIGEWLYWKSYHGAQRAAKAAAEKAVRP